jgi:hypothetical protein
MRAFVLIWGAMFFVSGGCAASGLHLPAMMLFPVPVALYWVSGQYRRALALAGAAALAGLLGAFSVLAAVFYVLSAELGVLMGVVLSRRWPLGRSVAMVTAAVYLFAAGSLLVNWQANREWWTINSNARISEWQAAVESTPGAPESAMIEIVRWYDVNWPYLVLGMLFGMILLGATVVMTWLTRFLRRRGLPASPEGFRHIRIPEWVVWLAILTALLWFADRRWPSEALRIVAWNSAIGLAFVYWLNGLSILVYALGAFKMHPMISISIFLALFWLGLHPMLLAPGLFDTWWNFRQRFDLLAEASKNRPEDGE